MLGEAFQVLQRENTLKRADESHRPHRHYSHLVAELYLVISRVLISYYCCCIDRERERVSIYFVTVQTCACISRPLSHSLSLYGDLIYFDDAMCIGTCQV